MPTMSARIDAFGDQIAGFIPLDASVLQTDFRIDAERNARLLAAPTKSEMPTLGALSSHKERQAIRVFECVIGTARASLPDGGI
jgi:hypothetical protein